MKKAILAQTDDGELKALPVFIQRDEDGFYVAECPVFDGCFTQGKTVAEALKNLRVVFELVLEEPDEQERLDAYDPVGSGVYSVAVRA